MVVSEHTAKRILQAVLENIGDWQARVMEIEQHANPGNKVRALSLARDLEFAKIYLRRLSRMDDDA